jgi:fatty-acid peroxygenase
VFYDEEVVERAGAVPPALAWLLFGRGAVHGLDDADHRQRKSAFLELLTPHDVAGCADAAEAGLRARLQEVAGGRDGGHGRLHHDLVEVYGRAVLDWVGVPYAARRPEALSRRYAEIVDGFGFAGSAYLRGWHARRASDAWARALVADVRQGRVEVEPGSAVSAVTALDVDDRTAAVELGNIVRPTIAVSWLATFAALAVDALPRWRPVLADPGAVRERTSFVQEVRRLAPFVPALAGRVRTATRHEGTELRPGQRVVLDVRGINLDPARYPDPWTFDPRRFLEHRPGPFDLVPQGGGFPTGHRCPGESMTLQLLDRTVKVLAEAELELHAADVVDLARMPPLPPDGLGYSVRRAGASAA